MKSEEEQELIQICSELGQAYKRFKEAEKDKERWRKAFFRMADQVAGEEEPFSLLSKEDQMIYSRTISVGAPILDDEKLRAENSELWEQITYIPSERILKPLEELSDEELILMADYLSEGRKTAKLNPPRKAKEEELDADE